MPQRVGVVGAGTMGSGIGRVLGAHGAEVVTLLEGRSSGSVARAQAAGMLGASAAEVAGSDLILSIVPPGQAMAVAKTLAPAVASAGRKPIVVDCNAVDISTVREVGRVFGDAGARFVDGGIIGGPPKSGATGPSLYLSGSDARPAGDLLGRLGLQVRVIDGAVGAASALKMSYAGITKGITAVACVMMLGASRAGTADALIAELRESQPQLAARFARGLPDMVPKAHRWVAEMREIASFLEGDPAAQAMFEGAAQLYERVATNDDGHPTEVSVLEQCARELGAA